MRPLSEADARRRLVASLTTPIGLIKHAAAAERIWFQRTLLGLNESECDGHATGGDGSFVVTDGETLADVIAEFERASDRSRVIAADFDLDDTKPHHKQRRCLRSARGLGTITVMSRVLVSWRWSPERRP